MLPTKKVKKGKDYSKYMFHGEQYGKATLVHAVVKAYLKEHPGVTVDKLKEVFPKKEVHSAFDIVEKADKAAPGRFFLQPQRIIKLGKSKIAVSSQWGKDNIELFIKHVRKNLKMNIRHVHVREVSMAA